VERERDGERERREEKRRDILLTKTILFEEEAPKVIGIRSILIICNNSRINLETEHEGIDPSVKQQNSLHC